MMQANSPLAPFDEPNTDEWAALPIDEQLQRWRQLDSDVRAHLATCKAQADATQAERLQYERECDQLVDYVRGLRDSLNDYNARTTALSAREQETSQQMDALAHLCTAADERLSHLQTELAAAAQEYHELQLLLAQYSALHDMAFDTKSVLALVLSANSLDELSAFFPELSNASPSAFAYYRDEAIALCAHAKQTAAAATATPPLPLLPAAAATTPAHHSRATAASPSSATPMPTTPRRLRLQSHMQHTPLRPHPATPP